MKIFILLLLTFNLITPARWNTNFNSAKEEASKSNKLILLNFSGSDWCIPCIQTKKEIFDSEVFMQYANEHLVLVNADFPRKKGNQLDPALIKSNEALADIYDPNGEFPLTIVMDAKGKVIKEWEGFPGVSATEFVEDIKQISHGAK